MKGAVMKKVVAIFLIVFGLFIFNITQASAGCNIVWTGDLSGSVPTSETSRTPQAAQELSIVLFNDLQWQCELDLCIVIFIGILLTNVKSPVLIVTGVVQVIAFV